MAPSRSDHPPRGPNGDHANKPPNAPLTTSTSSTTARIGPHPGIIKSSNQYTSESRIRRLLTANNGDPSREDPNRLQGVQLLNDVRHELHLPIRTFDTACVYFHRFRLSFSANQYNSNDVALASLFVACKVEDTIKKSREILAAAYNIKNSDKPATADDKMFDGGSKVIIGLERLILETIGFDFRTRYPQKLLVKVIRHVIGPSNQNTDEAKTFFNTAYEMSIDMYKTFIPIKRTTFSMVMAIAELTARILSGGASGGTHLDSLRDFAERKKAEYSRHAVVESMLDLLDLYSQHHKATRLGARFELAIFMQIKISLNEDIAKESIPRHIPTQCPRCETADPGGDQDHLADIIPSESPGLTPSGSSAPRPKGQDGTMRFVFDPEAARSEREMVGGFYKEEFEEYEVEVDEPVPPPPQHPSQRRDEDGGDGRGGGRGRGRRHRDRGDHRWSGPYPPPGGGGYRGGDRHRGRGRHR